MEVLYDPQFNKFQELRDQINTEIQDSLTRDRNTHIRNIEIFAIVIGLLAMPVYFPLVEAQIYLFVSFSLLIMLWYYRFYSKKAYDEMELERQTSVGVYLGLCNPILQKLNIDNCYFMLRIILKFLNKISPDIVLLLLMIEEIKPNLRENKVERYDTDLKVSCFIRNKCNVDLSFSMFSSLLLVIYIEFGQGKQLPFDILFAALLFVIMLCSILIMVFNLSLHETLKGEIKKYRLFPHIAWIVLIFVLAIYSLVMYFQDLALLQIIFILVFPILSITLLIDATSSYILHSGMICKVFKLNVIKNQLNRALIKNNYEQLEFEDLYLQYLVMKSITISSIKGIIITQDVIVPNITKDDIHEIVAKIKFEKVLRKVIQNNIPRID